MRSYLLAIVALTAVTPALLGQSSTDSKPLGDVAREARTAPKKPTAHVYDDDNFRKSKAPDTSEAKRDAKQSDAPQVDADGNPVPASETKSQDSEVKNSESTGEAKAEEKVPEKQKADITKDWKDRVAAKRDAIQLLEREISVAEREHKLRASSNYADAGIRLRNEQAWLKEEKQFNTDMESKQQKLAQAREELNSMLEEARRAGVNGLD